MPTIHVAGGAPVVGSAAQEGTMALGSNSREKQLEDARETVKGRPQPREHEGKVEQGAHVVAEPLPPITKA